jgi:hypothetical protein
MTKVTVDAETRVKLNHLNGLLEVCDEGGRTLGFFHPVMDTVGQGGPTSKSPFTREDLERRRQDHTGRPLTEILERHTDQA